MPLTSLKLPESIGFYILPALASFLLVALSAPDLDKGLSAARATVALSEATAIPSGAHRGSAAPYATVTVTPVATSTCEPAWHLVSHPGPDPTQFPSITSMELSAVRAVSANDVWALGSFQDAMGYQSRALAEHWDGTRWQAVTVNAMPDLTIAIRGMSDVSASDIWAVGYRSNALTEATLMLHWDGNSWTETPGGLEYASLLGAAALASNDVWVVGENGLAGRPDPVRTLVEHYNGNTWSIVPSPTISGTDSYLTAVRAVAPDDIWAVGYSRTTTATATLVEHWDGSAWSLISTPPSGGTLSSVVALAHNNVWAIGTDASFQTLILHWDGASWISVPGPNGPGAEFILSATAISPQDIWAVGHQDSADYELRTLVEHYNGNTWSIVPSPNFGPGDNALYGVDSVSASDIWSAGYGSSNSIIERYSPSCSTPTPTPCPMSFADVHENDYFYTPIQYLYCNQVVSGYSDNTFRPYANTTRGQICKIIVLAEGLPIDLTGAPHFQDVTLSNPFYSYIETAYNKDIVSGYGCGNGCLQFLWGNNVTRGQLCKIVVNAENWPIVTGGGYFEDVLPGDPFYGYIQTAYNYGIISGYRCSQGASCLDFFPGNSATRGQVSKILYLAVTQQWEHRAQK